MVFIDSGPFALDAVHPEDPRTPLTRRFLDLLGRSGQGITGAFNVLEVAGALSHRARAESVAQFVRLFQKRYRVRITPSWVPFMVELDPVLQRIRKRMGVGDAITLWLAETCRPAASVLVTWNAKDFAGRTALEVKTPQQFLRGQ